ncbi:MAG: hypothetical protein JXP34_21000 [Planctomycetes bacterium]|nr:hypothetical protein [Planctomycetota bacterium]
MSAIASILATVISAISMAAAPPEAVIVTAQDASPVETFAAREIRRYVYLRTGELLPIRHRRAAPGAILVIAIGRDRRGRLEPQEYAIGLGEGRRGTLVWAGGGTDEATLYAAYRLAEHFGVRFYLHGDTIPDGEVPLDFSGVDESARPLFALRGIQPFHDFPEGPDWWDVDDYEAYLGQLPKLRMNFFGLHTYPEGAPNAEPTVWIGLPSEVEADGRVRASYPSSYQSTLRGNWGYAPKRTSDYAFGTSSLFEVDGFGNDVMRGFCPQPDAAADCDEVFHRAAAALNQAFGFARRLGIKTCAGTETPLTIPARVKQRIEAMGKDPADPAILRELYEGIFARIAKAYPLDYYWFWTPEGWTWSGVKEDAIKKTIDDLMTAIAAAKGMGAPFRLATCGWVLGPQTDRSLFDKILPEGMAVSCISRAVGHDPVEPGFANVGGRPKWAIPWLEDDPALTSPQLWVGRMRRDAADALRYGCTGLMGIHWRTRVLAPNVAALARAAWDQSGWGDAPADETGPVGGQVASFPASDFADTEDDPLYRTVRYDMTAYRFTLPNGSYEVTLRFCEPHYGEAGKRVFGVKIEGAQVIDKLDVFAKVGKDRALDFAFDDVKVEDGRLDIDFVHQVEFPCIAAIAVEGPAATKKVNCGGPAYGDYAADVPASSGHRPSEDFYLDWARAEFGPEASEDIAKLFARIDGKLPRPSDWVNGPGGLRPDGRPWADVEGEYAFVDDLGALAARIRGKGNRDRFAYWLDTFRYMRAMAETRCIWAAYDKAFEAVGAEKDEAKRKALAREKALPIREDLVRAVGDVYAHLISTISNPGELGTLANWEQHILPGLIEKPGAALAAALGGPLPAKAMLAKDYAGPPRVIVPTVRTSIEEGRALALRVLILSAKPVREAALSWRPMGEGEFASVPLAHVARGVYTVSFPEGGAKGEAIEYGIRVAFEGGEVVRFPATAPERNQTVVVIPRQAGG